MNSFEFENFAITSALWTQLKTKVWMTVGQGEECLIGINQRDLGGGRFPLAANAARFPLPPLRDAAPRNAQLGRACSHFNEVEDTAKVKS